MSQSITGINEEKIRRATKRLAQLEAKTALRELRIASRRRMQERREQAIRRRAFGDAVLAAGLADWNEQEVIGLLLAAKAQFGTSETARKLYRERASQEGVTPRSMRH